MRRFLVPPLLALAVACSVQAAEKPPLGPFFEPGYPFYQTLVDLRGKEGWQKENVAVRGIVVPLSNGLALAFDQDLLRIAGIWEVPKGKPLVTLSNMAQTSWAEPHKKAGMVQSAPSGTVLFADRLRPGAAPTAEGLKKDPRTANESKDLGRGPLPEGAGRFAGIQLTEKIAVLSYRVGSTPVREWHEAANGTQRGVLRHVSVEGNGPVTLSLGPGNWSLLSPRVAWWQEPGGRTLAIAVNSAAVTLAVENDELIAKLKPGANQRVTLGYFFAPTEVEGMAEQLPATPVAPIATKERRWKESVTTTATPDTARANGLAMDRIALPEQNPWQRRMRAADVAFLTPDLAAVLTYDGDVWLADGLGAETLGKVTWHRYASGLHEPLAIAEVKGALQVATKNGLVRLSDRDGNGEADWYENFSDAMRQSQSTRSFPLDMDFGPDGSTYLSQGGIAPGSAAAGGITRISPDGRTAQVLSTAAREPYVTVHPTKGWITGTDQQGNFIPSTACYWVKPGDNFGFNQETPAKLTEPLVWIPHSEDNSAASQLWLTEAPQPWRDRLLHLSYGNGKLFLICPDPEAPVPQGAVIPLGFKTWIPLLQAKQQPQRNAIFVAGFQIYDSRATEMWALARLRFTKDPVTTAVDAKSCKDGVILTFAEPLDPQSVATEKIEATAWNYWRSKQYGSGRYQLDGKAGVTPMGIGQTLLSTDRKSVFIQLPDLQPVMQLEIRHDFKLASGAEAKSAVYFTVHQPRPLEVKAAGFPQFDPNQREMVFNIKQEEPASLQLGLTLSQSMGCVACHSIDGSTEGKTGPSWKGLFGIDRDFEDGSMESANEFYIRDSILDPMKKIVKGYKPGMASYKGVLSDAQIESLILYIRSLK